jgi:hypothetical protein
MEVPITLAGTARRWDEQHLDLDAASGQIEAAPTAGFTSGVSGAAARFAAAWARHTSGLGATAEARADGLRASAEDFLATDGAVADDHLLLRSLLGEVR